MLIGYMRVSKVDDPNSSTRSVTLCSAPASRSACCMTTTPPVSETIVLV
jgi:hypothetical protein